ncbi:MAG: acetate--CoA ligase family protein [Paracoccaceae bacterium]|nr:acetate--CoA ligase family protein [Paracoccaceae bacterium]
MLSGVEARALVAEAGIPFAPWSAADGADAACVAAAQIGWPVALKTAAADVVHKSDAGCVALGLSDEATLRAAYDQVTANAATAGSATPDGVLVERMAEGLAEVVLGIKRSETFGPVLMLGLGGIWVELLQDTSLRLCPITEGEARAMLTGLRGAALLTGRRGRPPCDLDAIAEAAASLSRLAIVRPDILELDLNPVLALDAGAVAIDARVALGALEAT